MPRGSRLCRAWRPRRRCGTGRSAWPRPRRCGSTPPSLALYVRQRGHRSVDLPHEVHVDDPLELLWGRLFEGGEESHRGEVHPGVDIPVHLYGAVGHSLYLIELRGIGDHVRRLAALAPYLVHQRGEPRLAAGRDDHLGAPIGEAESRLPPYSAGGAHQHHHLLFYRLELHHQHSFCAFRPSYEPATRTYS